MPDPIELLINVPQIIEDIDALEERIEEALLAKTQYLTHLFAERVRQNLSGEVLHTRSGRLLGTVLEQGPASTGSEITSGVQAGGEDAPYGIVHEEGGLSWYMIYPLNGRALAFEIDGKKILAASVHHPPLPRRSWFGSVEEEMEPLWGDELQAAIGEVL